MEAGAGAGEGASKTDSVVGEATAEDQGEETTRREATVAAARSKTHHATCNTVSFAEAFLHDKGRTGVLSALSRGDKGSKGCRVTPSGACGEVVLACRFLMQGILRARVYGGVGAESVAAGVVVWTDGGGDKEEYTFLFLPCGYQPRGTTG